MATKAVSSSACEDQQGVTGALRPLPVPRCRSCNLLSHLHQVALLVANSVMRVANSVPWDKSLSLSGTQLHPPPPTLS